MPSRVFGRSSEVADHMANMGFGPLPNVPDAYIRIGVEVHDSKLARLRAYYQDPKEKV
jgi:hypothetical protein